MISHSHLCKHKHSCIWNALLGMCRAGIIGCSITAGLRFIFNIISTRRINIDKILEILKSKDTYQFGMFLGSYSAVFKFVLCTCRYIRKKEDAFNSIIAGALSGLTIVLDSPERSMDISLYTFAKASSVILLYALQSHSHNSRNKPIQTVSEHFDILLFCPLVSVMILFLIYEPWNMSTSYYKLYNKMERNSPLIQSKEIIDRIRVAFRSSLGLSIDDNNQKKQE
jgi:hypothetical protein